MVNPLVTTVSRVKFPRLTKLFLEPSAGKGLSSSEFQWLSRLGVGWKHRWSTHNVWQAIVSTTIPTRGGLKDPKASSHSLVVRVSTTIPTRGGLKDWSACRALGTSEASMTIPTRLASCKLVMIKIATVGWKRVLLCPQNINNINLSKRTIICQRGQVIC